MRNILIPVFPGTNCETETLLWLADNLETNVEFFSLEKHSQFSAKDLDAIVIPGGFSYGDYLRAGALAARSPEMLFVKKMAAELVPILGICNGFQILCESKLLPGALIKNTTRLHHHFPVALKINFEAQSVWLPKLNTKQSAFLRREYQNFLLPMSCGMGNWQPGVQAEISPTINPLAYYLNNENGSYKSIAGILNSAGNVLGLMPHPERASDPAVGSMRGLLFLLGLAQSQKIKIRSGSPLEMFFQNLEGADLYVHSTPREFRYV